MTDWKTLSRDQGLQLSDDELARLAASLDPVQPAYQALAARLTPDIEPATTFAEEAVETH